MTIRSVRELSTGLSYRPLPAGGWEKCQPSTDDGARRWILITLDGEIVYRATVYLDGPVRGIAGPTWGPTYTGDLGGLECWLAALQAA